MARTYTRTPTVYQMEISECGAASLSMIMRYYGRFVGLEQLRVDTGVSRDGCNAKNICIAAEKYGLSTKGRNKSTKKLVDTIKPPCIIHWNFNHFVVYEGRKHKHYYINDPALGRRRLSFEELDDGFTGVVLLFEKNENFTKSKKERKLFRYVKDRLEGQRGALKALLRLGLCMVLPAVITPLFTQIFIDDILLDGNTNWMLGLLIAMTATMLFNGALSLLRGDIILKFQNKMTLTSVYKLVSHMLRLPMNFYEQRYAGDLTQRIENNNNVSIFLGGDLTELGSNLFIAVFLVLVMFIISPLLAAIGTGITLLNLVLVRLSSNAMATQSMKFQQDYGRLVGTAFNGISVSSSLKAVGAENEYTSRVLGYYAKSARMEQTIEKRQQMINAIPDAINSIMSVVVLMVGGVQVVRGMLTPGTLMAFSGLLSSFNAPVNALMGFVNKVQQTKADLGRVEDIMQYEQDPLYSPEREAQPMKQKLSGSVDMKAVSFGYGSLNPPTVKGVDFHLDCGKSVALVGASGSGKSTIAKLVSSLYVPWQGDILFDGISYRNIPRDVLFASISTVSQNITLFSGTIRENITMWNPTITSRDIINAATDACIHDDITRKHGGYDYILHEDGTNLSGGQRQRLEIAKALASNPTILIMDEATSSLDPIMEAQIMRNIKRRGCSCIVVAQRLSSIRDCDEILVIERGKILERGNHEELMALGKRYFELIQKS